MNSDELNKIIFLFQNRTIDGNGTPAKVLFPTGTIKVSGVWDGAIVKFQTLAPQRTPAVWIDVPDTSGALMTFTSNAQRVIEYFVQNEQIRAVLSNSGILTDITATLELS